ncbi:uncharacterized protein A4U43_C01F19680 [Asparagus officinalis]|uniref:Pentatricopeptide repeat-containing protein n=1 Tax=Asparagus officinalis TaxID=4686 RepID=A0A5P1FQM9_ASPOF|nr:uncharacterized protein A4U43_C01F19680 [Asparagus officinalis]
MESLMEEYRHVDGIKIAPSGRMSVSLFRSGETIDGHVRTQMEELWTIEEVDFNIQGLTMECFLPPASLQEGKKRKVPKSLGYLNEMRRNDIRPNVVNFSTFIDAFCKEGMMNEAMKFFVDMRIRGLTPNEFTYTSLIDGNCKADNLKEALIAG